jgi:phosphate/phosphite/phosphonate ABC transporter binding protein
MKRKLIVFGFSDGGTKPAPDGHFAQFAEVLGRRIRCDVALFATSSYEELATAIASHYVDVAWLPPIPFVSLQQQALVVPLVHLRRGGSHTFRSALVARADSGLRDVEQLPKCRAGWVDRHSASGYVIPRIELERRGIDPRVSFVQQRFFHSHESVIRAVLGGLADFGATYVGVAPDNTITRSPWKATESVRVITVFGDIPGDVVAARIGLDLEDQAELHDALLGISTDHRSTLLARGAFGVDEFSTFEPEGYADLGRAVKDAEARRLLDTAAEPARRLPM